MTKKFVIRWLPPTTPTPLLDALEGLSQAIKAPAAALTKILTDPVFRELIAAFDTTTSWFADFTAEPPTMIEDELRLSVREARREQRHAARRASVPGRAITPSQKPTRVPGVRARARGGAR